MSLTNSKLTGLFRSIVLLLVTQCAIVSFSQEQSQTPQAAAQPAGATGRMDVYQILDYARRVSDDARGIDPRADEIKLLLTLADSVWSIDPVLGKRLLSRSFDLTAASLGERFGVTDPQRTSLELLFNQISSVAARHDPKFETQLSERWEHSLLSLVDQEGKPTTDPTQLSRLLLSQSARLLDGQQQKARAVFRQSVLIRVLPEHCFFLINQRTRDAAITDDLFSDTLNVLSQRPISEANEILVLSSYLFSPDSSINYLAVGGYNAANAAGNVSATPKNTALAKQYLSLLLAKLNPSESVPSEVAYFALKNLVPQYTALAPDHLQDLYAKLATWGPNISSNSTKSYESAREGFTASDTDAIAGWEKRVQQADKIEDANRRDFEYFTIILGYLLPKKDFTQALKLATRIDKSELQQTLIDFVNLRLIQVGPAQARVDSRTEADFGRIKDPLLKAVALSSAAQAQINQKTGVDAIPLLNQASEEAKRISSDQDRLQIQLMLTQLYLMADSSRGFSAAASVFKAINQLPEFNIRRSSVSVGASVYGMTSQLEVELPTSSSLISTVGKMCGVNCTETFETCRLLERKNVRLWAMVEAVRISVRSYIKEVKTATVSPTN